MNPRRTAAAVALASLVVLSACGVTTPCLTGASCVGTSASPPATRSAATTPPVSATNTPAPTVGVPTQFGFISRQGAGFVLRSETSATPIQTLPSADYRSQTMSRDGRRLAYWTESAGTAELHVLELAGRDEIVARFPNMRAGGIAWSADMTGILVSMGEPRADQFVISRIVVAVELGSRRTREVYRLSGPEGASVIPLAWRGPPEVFAVYETGPGGYDFGYTVIRDGAPPVRTDPVGQAIGMIASPDQSLILGTWLNPTSIRVWPIDDFAHPTELTVAASDVVQQPRWWPAPPATADRPDVVYAIATKGDGTGPFSKSRIERWNVASGARTIVKALGDGPLGTFAVRPDGSGMVVQLGSDLQFIDVRSGQVTPLPSRTGEQIQIAVVLR